MFNRFGLNREIIHSDRSTDYTIVRNAAEFAAEHS